MIASTLLVVPVLVLSRSEKESEVESLTNRCVFGINSDSMIHGPCGNIYLPYQSIYHRKRSHQRQTIRTGTSELGTYGIMTAIKKERVSVKHPNTHPMIPISLSYICT